MLIVNKSKIEKLNLEEPESLKLLYQIYYKILCDYAYKITCNTSIAEDIVQTFYIRLWEKRLQLSPELKFQSYAYQAIKNAAIDYLRKKKNRDKFLQEIINETGAEESGSIEYIHKKQIREALKKVPYKSRKVFGLGCIAGFKYNEIADLMHISVNTVKSQMTVAFRILREELKHLK